MRPDTAAQEIERHQQERDYSDPQPHWRFKELDHEAKDRRSPAIIDVKSRLHSRSEAAWDSEPPTLGNNLI